MKTGRNDACPCGSGEKYKRCCGQMGVDGGVAAQMPGTPTPAQARERLLALFQAGRHAELEHSARALLAGHPDSGLVWAMLGAALQLQGKEALPALQRAAALSPDDAVTHYNLGNALKDLDRPAEAVLSYRRALAIMPGFAQCHNNLGNALADLWQLDQAVDSYRHALALQPDNPRTHRNLGSALKDAGRIDAALTHLRRALEIAPDYLEARSDLLFTYNFQSKHAPQMLVDEARRYGRQVEAQARPYTRWPQLAPGERVLRVGLVSADLRNHPVGYFVESMLAAMAGQPGHGIAFFAYFNHAQPDDLSARLKSHCRSWLAVAGLGDEALAARIHADAIDILIDLSGHSAQNRLPMFAWKPAPVQVSWLGYFATTGCAAIDYLIADPWSAPASAAACFTETLWPLPETRLCFTPPRMAPAVTALPALERGALTFGCFNSLSKMSDAVVALWSRILRALPQSRLLLKAQQLNDAQARRGVEARFAAQGIGVERLMLLGASPRGEYLAGYAQVDIALDPFPYTGGATTVDALWMGVPVLSLAGESLISRQSMSLLINAGLSDWVADDPDAYVALALRHAQDLTSLAALRLGLREQLRASPLFDAPRFAAHFAAALKAMWARALVGVAELG